MDDNQLAEKFRDAVGDVPPPSFDTNDVLVASRRATARARKRLQAGAGVALGVVLIGGALVLVRPFAENNTMSTAGAGDAASPNATSPLSLNPGFNTNNGGPKAQPNTPDTGGSANCGAPDQGLAAALVTELPIITGSEAQAADVSCPTGAAAVAFQLTDGANSGKLELVLVPSSVANDPGTGSKPAVRVANGNSVTVKTHNGGALTLATLPMNGSAAGPYVNQLGDIAARLAARY
jgi:hypothetical protein